MQIRSSRENNEGKHTRCLPNVGFLETAAASNTCCASVRPLVHKLDETIHPLFINPNRRSVNVTKKEMNVYCRWGNPNWFLFVHRVMVTGSQKGLMTPPGLGILFYNAKADRARDRADCVTHYWDWRRRTDPKYYYHYFDGTAPTHHLYGLREALNMIAEEGIEAIWARHAALARGVWAALETWGAKGRIAPNVPDRRDRSHAVTAVQVGDGEAARLRNWVASNAGVTLGIALGMQTTESAEKDNVFRIGHMGHVNAQMVMGALGAIEMGLKATGIPIGSGGLDAAVEAMWAGHDTPSQSR